MEKIKIGEYVRIQNARRVMISRIYDIKEGNTSLIKKKYFCMIEDVEEWFTEENIIKHSIDIEDILDLGDLVEIETSYHFEDIGRIIDTDIYEVAALNVKTLKNKKCKEIGILKDDEVIFIPVEKIIRVLPREEFDIKSYKVN